jgi:hypothetical protein
MYVKTIYFGIIPITWFVMKNEYFKKRHFNVIKTLSTNMPSAM